MHLTLDEVAVLLGADVHGILELAAAGHLTLAPDGVALAEVERLLDILKAAPRG
jgi:hypothetical protein